MARVARRAAPPLQFTFSSADLVVRICAHELGQALASRDGVDLTLEPLPNEYYDQAIRLIDDMVDSPRCQEKR